MNTTNSTQPTPTSAIQFDIAALTDLVSDGRIFSTVFTKKNGQQRHMVCRTGVAKGLTGAGAKYDAASKGILPVWDMQAGGYRSIPVEAITTLKAHGQTFTTGGAL